MRKASFVFSLLAILAASRVIAGGFAVAVVSGTVTMLSTPAEGSDCVLWFDTGSKSELPVSAPEAVCLEAVIGQQAVVQATAFAQLVPLECDTQFPSGNVVVTLRAIAIQVPSS